MKSFIPSLIEETHCDLSSSIIGISRAPMCEILTLMPRNFEKGLCYQITVRKKTNGDSRNGGEYEPGVGDLIALTENIRPNSIQDLNRPRRFYHVAYVQGLKCDQITILSSKPIEIEPNMRSKKAQKLYAVYLLNMITNIRIWKALNSQLVGANLNIIGKVLQADSKVRIRWCLV